MRGLPNGDARSVFSSPFLSCTLSCEWMDGLMMGFCGFARALLRLSCVSIYDGPIKSPRPKKKTKRICFQHLEQIFMRCKKVFHM